MSCVSIADTSPGRRIGRRRGLTLTELMVALAIALLLTGAVLSTFMVVLQVSDKTEVQLDAIGNARHALELLSSEIKALEERSGSYFRAADVPTLFGDGLDDDDDGAIDEEQPNGADDDGDWADLHNPLPGTFERPEKVGVADLGDEGVDEDNVFHTDILSYRVFPSGVSSGDWVFEDVTYAIGALDGRTRMLVRTRERVNTDGSVTQSQAPVASNVLSFNCLYWDGNQAPDTRDYVTEWPVAGGGSGFQFPASVHISLVIYADTKPIETYNPGDEVQTLSVQTMVNVESVIQDAGYARP